MEVQEMANAVFSDDKKHRWVLWRKWDESKPKVMFIGLNPSTADATQNDNTIKKVIKIARHNGYGGIYMLNLFTYITPHPQKLLIDDRSIEISNRLLNTYALESGAIVFCWGNFKQARDRGKYIATKFPNAFCLKQNANGSPMHPLFCLDKSPLIPFNYNI